MRHKKVALIALIIGATCALLVPVFAFASDTMGGTDDTPSPFADYTYIYKLPNISLVYYRVDTAVRANSLPINLYIGVKEDTNDSYGVYYTMEILLTTTENGDTKTILKVNSDDFEPEDDGRYYWGFRTYDMPAYLSATGVDYSPRYHTGIFSARFDFPVYAGESEITRKLRFEGYNAYSITTENVRVDMSTLNVFDAYAMTQVENPSTGYIKGLTTIRLFNIFRGEVVDVYEPLEISFFTGATETTLPGGDTYYFKGIGDAVFDAYEDGYLNGELDGTANSAQNNYNSGYNAGYNAGKNDYYDIGYSEGFFDGQSGAPGAGQTAKNIFAIVWEIIDVPIAGALSVGDILLIIIILAVVFFFIRLARGS